MNMEIEKCICQGSKWQRDDGKCPYCGIKNLKWLCPRCDGETKTRGDICEECKEKKVKGFNERR